MADLYQLNAQQWQPLHRATGTAPRCLTSSGPRRRRVQPGLPRSTKPIADIGPDGAEP
jgi:hypothetical protein